MQSVLWNRKRQSTMKRKSKEHVCGWAVYLERRYYMKKCQWQRGWEPGLLHLTHCRTGAMLSSQFSSACVCVSQGGDILYSGCLSGTAFSTHCCWWIFSRLFGPCYSLFVCCFQFFFLLLFRNWSRWALSYTISPLETTCPLCTPFGIFILFLPLFYLRCGPRWTCLYLNGGLCTYTILHYYRQLQPGKHLVISACIHFSWTAAPHPSFCSHYTCWILILVAPEISILPLSYTLSTTWTSVPRGQFLLLWLILGAVKPPDFVRDVLLPLLCTFTLMRSMLHHVLSVHLSAPPGDARDKGKSSLLPLAGVMEEVGPLVSGNW